MRLNGKDINETGNNICLVEVRKTMKLIVRIAALEAKNQAESLPDSKEAFFVCVQTT
jgi:hypothetical protein